MVTRVNVAKARLRGVEAEARVRISPDWLASTYFSSGRGTNIDAHQPLRRVPPGVGGARLRWQPASRSFWLEAVGAFMTRYGRMAPGDLTDARMGAQRTTQSIAAYFNGTATETSAWCEMGHWSRPAKRSHKYNGESCVGRQHRRCSAKCPAMSWSPRAAATGHPARGAGPGGRQPRGCELPASGLRRGRAGQKRAGAYALLVLAFLKIFLPAAPKRA